MYLKNGLATQGKSCTRKGLSHNPHFGGIKSVHQGKVKPAGAQKSLTVHAGIQPEAGAMSDQPVLCRAHLAKGGQRGQQAFAPGTEPH